MENTSSIVLREVMISDLPIFFDQQLDPEANWMAAFTRKDPADRDTFMAHWTKILEDEAIITITIQKTIIFNGSVVGSVLSYVDEDKHLEVCYWIGKPYWSKGIATCALSAFLKHNKVRPLHGMKHPLVEQGKASSAIHRSLDEFQFCHMPFNHSVIDWPG